MKPKLYLTLVFIAASLVRGGMDDASLALELNKSHYIFGEPLIITLTLTPKRSGASMRGSFTFDSEWSLWYKHESEAEFRPYSEGRLDTLGNRQVNIPKQGVSFTVPIAHDANRAFFRGTDTQEMIYTLFATSGKYQLKARLQDIRPAVESNVVTVRVMAPIGDDAEAWNLWKDPNVTALVHERIVFGSEEERQAGLTKLRQLVSRYPNTVYASYGRQRLANETRGAVDSNADPRMKTPLNGRSAQQGVVTTSTSGLGSSPSSDDDTRHHWFGIAVIMAIIIATIAWKFKR